MDIFNKNKNNKNNNINNIDTVNTVNAANTANAVNTFNTVKNNSKNTQKKNQWINHKNKHLSNSENECKSNSIDTEKVYMSKRLFNMRVKIQKENEDLLCKERLQFALKAKNEEHEKKTCIAVLDKAKKQNDELKMKIQKLEAELGKTKQFEKIDFDSKNADKNIEIDVGEQVEELWVKSGGPQRIKELEKSLLKSFGLE